MVVAYGDKSLKNTQIYAIIKNVKECKTTTDQRKLNGRRKVWSPVFIANVTTDIKKDQRVMMRKLWPMVCRKTPFTICFTRT